MHLLSRITSLVFACLTGVSAVIAPDKITYELRWQIAIGIGIAVIGFFFSVLIGWITESLIDDWEVAHHKRINKG